MVFHCFSGDVAMVKQCAEAGYVMSFAGNVTFANAQPLRDAAAAAPPELVLVETDAPFLTPVPNRGRPNSPAMVAYTLRYLAEVKGMEVADLCDAVTATAVRTFGPWLPRGAWGASPGQHRPGVTMADRDVRLLGPADVRELAERLGVRPSKRLGQNFVIEHGTVRQIAALAALRPADVVLEVGPGLRLAHARPARGRGQPGDRRRDRPRAGRRTAADHRRTGAAARGPGDGTDR